MMVRRYAAGHRRPDIPRSSFILARFFFFEGASIFLIRIAPPIASQSSIFRASCSACRSPVRCEAAMIVSASRIAKGSTGHRSHASRSRFGVWLKVKVLGVGAPMMFVDNVEDLRFDGDLSRYVPNKTREFASDGDADFVLRQSSSHGKAAVFFARARQSRDASGMKMRLRFR